LISKGENKDMKSRGIAAGASVIALALATAGPSAAAELGDVAPKVNAEVGTGVDVNAQVGAVKTQANLGANVGHGTGATAGVKVKSDGSGTPSVGGQQTGHIDGSVRVSPSIAHPAKVTEHAGVRADTHVKRGHTSVRGESRFSMQADLRIGKHARVQSHAHSHASAALRGERAGGIGGERLVPKRRDGHFLPFRNIGRAVSNPIQPLLAGWLMLLTAGICLGAARMVRRRGHRWG
jgi:hypothetical protein